MRLQRARPGWRVLLLNVCRSYYLQKQASEDDVETALAKADAAKARADAAAQSLALTVVGPRQEDIAIAEAQLLAKEAEVQLAERHLHDASLYAPAAGVIRNRILDPGDMASPQSVIFTLALVDPVWARSLCAGDCARQDCHRFQS